MLLDATQTVVSQYWPYATLTATVVLMIMLRRARKRTRKVEAQLKMAQTALFQIQQRQLFEGMKSTSFNVTKANRTAAPSIVPAAELSPPLDLPTT
jgi:hypothetical protein